MKPLNHGLFMALVLNLMMGCASGKQSLELMVPVSGKNPKGLLTRNWVAVEEKTSALIHYGDQSDAWKHWARTAYRDYDNYQKSHPGKISSRDLLEIKHLANYYSNQIWRPLSDLMFSPYFFMDLTRDVQIQTQRESYVESGVVRYVDSMGDVVEYSEDPVDGTVYQEVRVDVYHINPLDREGQVFLREFEISFGAALVLMDNFVSAWEPYMNNKAIRRNLLYDFQGSQDDTRKMVKVFWKNYRSYKNSEKLTAAFDLYQTARQITRKSGAPVSHSLPDQLAGLIENNRIFKHLTEDSRRKNVIKQLTGEMKYFFRKQGDGLDRISNRTTYFVSKTFGNSTGLFQLRKGKLKNLPEPEYQEITNGMKPLDILFEKTPFRLTDKFIPGHYGHVAVWVGTERELRELGIWEQLPHLYDMAVKRYSYNGPSFQQSIRNGKHIIEALRPGVQMNSMRHFLDIDDLAVVRPKDCLTDTDTTNCLTLAKKKQYLLEAFKQVGKKYDFNFNVNTESEIVCSEMAYRTFVDTDFSTTRTFGKHSISPDQVASMADDPADPFYPILLYHEGNRIHKEGESLRKIFNLLLNKKYSAVEEAVE
jgi:hypothetical protein